MNKLCTYLFIILAAPVLGQHSPLISNYMLNGLVINPAYTGSKEVFTVNAMYRNQWTGFEGAPVNQVFSAHTPVKDKPLSVGLMFHRERAGVTQVNNFSGKLAYRIRMNEANLSFGISAGFNLISARYSELTTTQTNDLVFQHDLQGRLKPDFGAGVYYYTKRYFAGISVPTMFGRHYEIDQEATRISTDPSHYNILLHGGYLVDISETIKLKPSALFRFTPSGEKQFDLNLNVIFHDRFWLGTSYRFNESVVFLAEFQINNQLRAAYAYDFGMGAIRQYHGGSHEIALQYEFGYKVKSIDPRFF